LQVELQVPNPKGEILAGSYAQVRFDEATDAKELTLSDNALLFRAQGMQVAVVGSNHTVQLRSIKLGRDFGNTVQVLSGLDPATRDHQSAGFHRRWHDRAGFTTLGTNAPAR